MKNKNKILILLISVLFISGCTVNLKDKETNKIVKNPATGQSLTENILCRPIDKETIKIYEEYPKQVNIEKLPKCENFQINSGGYEGLWTSFFVKPLAFVIIKIGVIVKNYGLALVITSLLIRLITFPITSKTVKQSEAMNKLKPDLERLEKKYKDKTDQESMMKKSQEMSVLYQKHNINPLSSCLFAFLQIPIFIGFLEAINRVPAIFEGSFLNLQLGTTPIIAFQSGHWQYILVIVLVGITTSISFKKNMATVEAEQGNKMSLMMTVMITVMSVFMSSALGIYWITSNLFTIVQNLVVKKEKKA